MISERMTEAFEQKNGVLTLEQATELGFSKESVRKAYRRGDVIKADRGIYLLDDSFEDDLYIMQLKYSKGVYSYESASMLHGLTTFSPFSYIMTFPKGYHLKTREEQHIEAHFATPKFYSLGVMELHSWFGNPLRVTNLERTVIDMLRSPQTLPDIIEEVVSNYSWSEEKDLARLEDYARLYGVEELVKERGLIVSE
jgi:predicted transcriptional regulator of viral defense system